MLKQLVKPVLCLVIVSLAIPAMSRPVFAQGTLPPAISPWMRMLDRSRDGQHLDNYNRLVRPQQEQMRASAEQQRQLQAQQQALRAMQSSGGGSSGGGGSMTRDLLAPGGSSVGHPSSAANNMVLSPPREIPRAQRNPAGFNQYLHYYPPHALPRRPVPQFSPTGGGRR